MSTIESIILGAGPYGLSIAAHLRAANLDFRVIGSPMESWRMHMPAGMALKSEQFASSLSDPQHRHTLERFGTKHGASYQSVGTPIPIADFIAYADWFRAQFVSDIKAARATSMRRSRGGFELVLEDGEVVAARRVVVATGLLAFRHVPVALDPLPSALKSHSADHRDLSGFAGKDVTVVGAGQSALETAAIRHEDGALVRLLARKSAIDWNPDLDLAPSLLDRLRYPSAGLGPGWRNWLHSELPQAFAYLPASVRPDCCHRQWAVGRLVAQKPHDRQMPNSDLVGNYRRNRARRTSGADGPFGRRFPANRDRPRFGGHRLQDRRQPPRVPRQEPACGNQIVWRRAGPELGLRIDGSGPSFRRHSECAFVRAGHALRVRRQASGGHTGGAHPVCGPAASSPPPERGRHGERSEPGGGFGISASGAYPVIGRTPPDALRASS
jgi:hypothetical protein